MPLHIAEPAHIALLVGAFGVLLATSVLLSRMSGRLGVPVVLLFLLIGIAAGREGLGAITFTDYRFAFRIGTLALLLILFDGGLNTPLPAVRRALKPAAALATIGVVATAGLVALIAQGLGFAPAQAMLLGAIVSSTDAATVFSILRGSGIHLKKRVGMTLELESGLNDPMAVIMTSAITEHLVTGAPLSYRLFFEVLLQLGAGAVIGLLVGFVGRRLLLLIHLPSGGLYPVLTLALACVAFGAAHGIHGSGFLAVYVAALVIGNGDFAFRGSVLKVHDSIAWLSQIAMFLMMGLLIAPSQLLPVLWRGLVIGLLLTFAVRPLVAVFCLAPFRYLLHESFYIGWVGLRGAVPIVLATMPVLAHAEGAQQIFNLVFFVVVANAVVPGMTVRRVTRWLGLEAREPPAPPALLEINSSYALSGEVLAFYIDPASSVAEMTLADLPFPDGAAAMLVVRGRELIAPRGPVQLKSGDHVYVFCRGEDKPFIQLLFGQREE